MVLCIFHLFVSIENRTENRDKFNLTKAAMSCKSCDENCRKSGEMSQGKREEGMCYSF